MAKKKANASSTDDEADLSNNLNNSFKDCSENGSEAVKKENNSNSSLVEITNKSAKLEPLFSQKIKMENETDQHQPLIKLVPPLHTSSNASTSERKVKSDELPSECSGNTVKVESTSELTGVKEEKILDILSPLKEETDTTYCSVAGGSSALGSEQVCDKEEQSSNSNNRTTGVDQKSAVKSEDISESPRSLRGEKLKKSVSDENFENCTVSESPEKVKLSKKKPQKDTQHQQLQESISPGRSSLDGTKSPPSSPSNECAGNSRRTRCSFNPNFAQKQKKFLAMVSSSCWDEDESRDDDFEHSFDIESEGNNDGEIILRSTSKNNEEKKDVKSNDKPFARRGRPTKEMVQKRCTQLNQRKSARFDLPSEKSAVETSACTEDTYVIIDDKDRFCWACHRVDKHHASIQCVTCPRVYHTRCSRGQSETALKGNWSCPECTLSLKMESFENQSESMKLISADEFCSLLTRTIEFLSSQPGAEVFKEPVDLAAFPDYRDYIVNPVHLKKIQANIDKKLYGSTESFIADIKWLYHNSIVFNGLNSPLTAVAKSILVRCKSQMNQLERCVDCFKKSFDVSISESFLEACRQPHLLVWAKFKGYPFWPSKVFHWKMDNKNNCIVEVKFFNDYSRAWVPSKSIYLFSKKSPSEVNLPNSKDYRSYQNALAEAQKHISNLEERFGRFEFAPVKTEFNPDLYNEHLKAMLPEYDPVKLQARNTIISLSNSSRKKKSSSDQDLKNKTLTSPKSFKDKRLKGLKRNSANGGLEGPSLGSGDTVKKPKITMNELDSNLNSHMVEVGEEYHRLADTKEYVTKTEIVSKDSKIDDNGFKMKQKLSDPSRDEVVVQEKASPHGKDPRRVNSKSSEAPELFKVLHSSVGGQKSTNCDLSNKSVHSSDAHQFSSAKGVKRRHSDYSGNTSIEEKYPKMASEFSSDSVQTEKTMHDLVSPMRESLDSKLRETASKFSSTELQSILKKDSLQSELPRKPALVSRKNRASRSKDSTRTSSSEPDDSIFSTLSERPIGMETEARSLRVDPVSLDHEGSATRMFNFSVQQLVPLVSDALSNMMGKLANAGSKDALIQLLRMQIEEIQQKHMQEINSLKHVMNQQFLEYAHTSDIFRKQTEQKWSEKTAELEELLKKEKENLKTERENWRSKITQLNSVLQEGGSPAVNIVKPESG